MINNIFHFEEVLSTNDMLNEILRKEKPNEASIVWADFQTEGKGQIGNKWESEQGKNLTFSIVFFPTFLAARDQFVLSQMASLAVADFLSDKIENIRVKWPNDIYAGHKKIGGILIENVLSGYEIASTVIGIGININQTEFRSDAPNPTSLKLLTNLDFKIEDCLQKLRKCLIERYTMVCNEDIIKLEEDYADKLFWKDGYHKYSDKKQEFLAKIVGIKSSGHLILQKEDNTIHEYAFKEVEFII